MRDKISGVENFVKDSNNKAVLNVDKGALSAYKKQRAIISSAKNLSEEVDSLKNDVKEIKTGKRCHKYRRNRQRLSSHQC